MEVVVNNYLPGDQRLVDKIVYELKAQGIFDQFRKECFADVDTKPAYQNLRQRVENNVTGFLKEQSWRPDMNKNQVREMLRKRITESGYLEKGVERIVDQVVNPKINSVFLPKVEEVIYKYLGIEKPNDDNNKPGNNNDTNDDKNDSKATVEPSDLLPQDLEAVSPESEPIDKKDEKTNSNDSNTQDLDDSKMEEDESPPFEPLEEQSVYNPQEENSIDSHMSGFSGLISHESNVSSDNKPIVIDLNQQDSQMSRNSSESHLSIITSDDNNSKMDICCDDSQSKSIKSTDSNSKIDDNKINKIDKTIKPKPDNNRKDDKDRERERKSSTGSKDTKSRHSSQHSSRDKDRNRDHKSGTSSSSSNRNDKDRSRDKDKKSTSSSSSSSKHSSSKDKDRSSKESSSRDRDKDKNRSTSSHHDRDARKSGDSTRKSRKDDKSSSSHSSSSDRHKKDKEKDKRKDPKSKDDHYSSRDRKNDRRSNDRDSNGSSTSANNNNNNNNSDQSNKQSNDSSTQSNDFKNSNSGDSNNSNGNSEQKDEIEGNKLKLLKPKFASNIKEAMKLMKIRKQLAKLEKQNQLSLSSVDVNTTLLSSSICLDDVKPNGLLGNNNNNNNNNNDNDSMVITQDNWDRMEAKLNQQIVDDDNYCKYFENDENDVKNLDFKRFVNDEIMKFDEYSRRFKSNKRTYNHINNNQSDYCVKRRKSEKKNHNSSHIVQQTVESFPLPLSPAESDNSLDRKEATPPLKPKRNYSNKSNNQRYSSEDLYKPRLTFISSRRRGTRPSDN